MSTQSDTRTRILDAAQDLIQRRGVNGMSFKDISDVVGIRKPSIHHHFASKHELVEALLNRYRDQFDRVLNEILESERNAQSKLQQYAEVFVQTLTAGSADRSCLCGMLAAEIYSLSEIASDAVNGFLCDNVSFLSKILTDGRADGSLVFDGAAEDSAGMILSTLEGALIVARGCGGPKQMKAISRQLVSCFSSG